MKFGTNRGDKIHVVDYTTLDNATMESPCGTRIDTLLENRYINKSELCGNCTRTNYYKDAVK